MRLLVLPEGHYVVGQLIVLELESAFNRVDSSVFELSTCLEDEQRPPCQTCRWIEPAFLQPLEQEPSGFHGLCKTVSLHLHLSGVTTLMYSANVIFIWTSPSTLNSDSNTCIQCLSTRTTQRRPEGNTYSIVLVAQHDGIHVDSD